MKRTGGLAKQPVARCLVSRPVSQDQQRIVIQHFFKVGHQIVPVRGVSGKPESVSGYGGKDGGVCAAGDDGR